MSLDPSAPGWWEAIYAGGEPPWDKGAAAPPLVRALDEVALPVPSRVLVPGCGYGHEAIHLASLGHEVTAVDFAPAAVTALRERCAQAGVPMKTLEADLFDLPAYDLAPFDAVVEHTCFCALDPQRRDAYARLVASLLQGGGWMIGLFFEVEGSMEDGPPFPATRADVQRHFGSLFEVGPVDMPHDFFASRRGREWLATMRLVSASTNAED